MAKMAKMGHLNTWRSLLNNMPPSGCNHPREVPWQSSGGQRDYKASRFSEPAMLKKQHHVGNIFLNCLLDPFGAWFVALVMTWGSFMAARLYHRGWYPTAARRMSPMTRPEIGEAPQAPVSSTSGPLKTEPTVGPTRHSFISEFL